MMNVCPLVQRLPSIVAAFKVILYQPIASLSDQLKANLPTVEQMGMELDAVVSELSEGNEAVEQ